MILKIHEDTARICLHISWYRSFCQGQRQSHHQPGHPNMSPIAIISTNIYYRSQQPVQAWSFTFAEQARWKWWKQMRYPTDVPLIKRGETVKQCTCTLPSPKWYKLLRISGLLSRTSILCWNDRSTWRLGWIQFLPQGCRMVDVDVNFHWIVDGVQKV